MNEESHIPDLDPQLEARIVALVLGEVSDFEREELHRLIAQDPKLQAFQEAIQWVHGEMRDVATGEWPEVEQDWKLSPERRRKVQMAIAGESPSAPSVVPNLRTSLDSSSSSGGYWSFPKLGVALAGVSVVALVAVTVSYYSYRSARHAAMASSQMRLLESESRAHWSVDASGEKRALLNELAKMQESAPASYETGFVPPSVAARASTREFLEEGAVSSGRDYYLKDNVQFVPNPTAGVPDSAPAHELRQRFRYGAAQEAAPAISAPEDRFDNGLASNLDGFAPATVPTGPGLGTASPDGSDQGANWFGANGVATPPASDSRVWLSDDMASDQPMAGEVVEFYDEMQMQDADMGMMGLGYDADVAGDQGGMGGMGGGGFGVGGFGGARGGSPVASTADPANRPASGRVSGLTESDQARSDATMSAPDRSLSFQQLGQQSLGLELPNLELPVQEAFSQKEASEPAPSESAPSEPASSEPASSEPALGAVVVPSFEMSRDGNQKAKALFESGEPLGDAGEADVSQLDAIVEGRSLGRAGEAVDFDVDDDGLALGDRGQTVQRELKDLSKQITDFETVEEESLSERGSNEWDENAALGEELKSEVASLYGGIQIEASDQKQSQGVASSLLESEKFSLKMAKEAKKAAPPIVNETATAAEPFSTFSLHVSDVSFKLAASALARGEWPEASVIRAEEFVNALDYGDPMPAKGEKVACRLEQCIHPFLQQRNLMRVSLRTAAAGRASSTPLRLTFVIDNSGSMERVDRRQTLRVAFKLLAQQLQATDQVTLISFARQPRLLADKVDGSQSGQLVQLIESLPSEGGTNIESALQLALEKALEQHADQAQNRIILLTDGAVNLGDADPDSLSRMVVRMRDAGIAFDAAGISAEGLNDEILEALTRQGDGRYYLLDSPEDADEGFVRQIAGALRPSAKNVKVQIEFNPNRVERYKLIGFEKHLLNKEDFRNDAVDAAEMTAAEAGVAVYQFETKPDGEGDVGSVSVRFRDLSTGQMIENRWPIPYVSNAPRIDRAEPSMRLAAAAALLATRLRDEPLGQTVELKMLDQLLAELPAEQRNMTRVKQLQQMIQQARQLSGK